MAKSNLDKQNSQEQTAAEAVQFIQLPDMYISRIKAFGEPQPYAANSGMQKFGIKEYQVFICPLPDGTTLRFTSHEKKFIKAVENDDLAEFYYKPADDSVGGTSEIDYRTSKQVANTLAKEDAKRSAKLKDAIFNVDNIENLDSLRERLLSNSIDKLLNATT